MCVSTTVRWGSSPKNGMRQYGLLSGAWGISEGDHVTGFRARKSACSMRCWRAKESVRFDAGFDELRRKVKEFSGIEIAKEPDGFAGELRPYQRAGVGWLEFLNDFRFGGCLADDMGLGKTVQFLALLQDRFRKGQIKNPSLVVVPKSLIFNWHQECTRFTPDLTVIEYTGLARARLRKKFAKSHVILTTYGTVRRDILHLKETNFEYIVLDEAQAIKNPGSQVAKAARLLKANNRLGCSLGTPIENHLCANLWSIFRVPGTRGCWGGRRSSSLHTTEGTDEESRKLLLARAAAVFILRPAPRARWPVSCPRNSSRRSSATWASSRSSSTPNCATTIAARCWEWECRKKQGLAKSKIHVLEAACCGCGRPVRAIRRYAARREAHRRSQPPKPSTCWGLHLSDLLEEGHKAARVFAIHELPGDRPPLSRTAQHRCSSTSTARPETAKSGSNIFRPTRRSACFSSV